MKNIRTRQEHHQETNNPTKNNRKKTQGNHKFKIGRGISNMKYTGQDNANLKGTKDNTYDRKTQGQYKTPTWTDKDNARQVLAHHQPCGQTFKKASLKPENMLLLEWNYRTIILTMYIHHN